MEVNRQMSQEASQVPEESSRYTVEEQLTNSVRDVAGSWIGISVIGIGLSFFVKGGFYYTPYIWAVVSVWLWRSRSVAAARVLIGIAFGQFLLALWSKFVSPTLSLGLIWSAILLVAAIHALRAARALARYRQAKEPPAGISKLSTRAMRQPHWRYSLRWPCHCLAATRVPFRRSIPRTTWWSKRMRFTSWRRWISMNHCRSEDIRRGRCEFESPKL